MTTQPQLQDLARTVQKALLGAVAPDLRCFLGRVDGSLVQLRAVFARTPSEGEAEGIDDVETEVLADLDCEGLFVTTEVLVVAPPLPWRAEGWTAFFARKEAP